jgi:chromosomal replication initiation ATPase DnaA
MGNWKQAIDALTADDSRSFYRSMLEHCIAEQKGSVAYIKMPPLLASIWEHDQAVRAIIQQQLGVTSVKLVPDKDVNIAFQKIVQQKQAEEAKQRILDTKKQSSALAQKKEVASQSLGEFTRNTIPKIEHFEHFSLEDYLAPQFDPATAPLVLTSSNTSAYNRLEALLRTFPYQPKGQQPIMIWGDIGQGKTHLLQHFAWRLCRKIDEARQLLEKGDLVKGQALYTPELVDAYGSDTLMRDTLKSRLRYITAKALTEEHKNSHAHAWGAEDVERFSKERDRWYQHMEWLFLDDIQIIAKGNKQGTLEFAYSIVDKMMLHNGIVVSASDRNPIELEHTLMQNKKKKDLAHDISRLFTRLRSGDLIDLKPPTGADLQAVYLQRMTTLGVTNIATPAFGSAITNYRSAIEIANTNKRDMD